MLEGKGEGSCWRGKVKGHVGLVTFLSVTVASPQSGGER